MCIHERVLLLFINLQRRAVDVLTTARKLLQGTLDHNGLSLRNLISQSFQLFDRLALAFVNINSYWFFIIFRQPARDAAEELVDTRGPANKWSLCTLAIPYPCTPDIKLLLCAVLESSEHTKRER
jgi:hypothetical protein